MAQSLVVGGALPLGAFGAYRLLRPFASSSLPGIAAAAAYAANPIARNAIWGGELGPLVCFALAPFVLGAFVRVTDNGEEDDDRSLRRPRTDLGTATGRHDATVLHILCSVALLTAVAGSVWPPALLLAPALAIAYCLAIPFVGGARRAGARASAARSLRWSRARCCSRPGRSRSSAPTPRRSARSPARRSRSPTVLHFHTGRAGAGLAPWGIVAAAVVPLAIATGPRLSWATRAWVLAACRSCSRGCPVG